MTRIRLIAPVLPLLMAWGCQVSPGRDGAACVPATSHPTTAPALDVEWRGVTPRGTTVARLSNGLTVIVRENHNAPVVCVRSGVRAGSLYEGKYLGAGISHLVEHLVAEGATHAPADGAPAGQAPKPARKARVDRIGGESNAFTSMSHTGYFIAATAGKTDDCIDLVADWMARARITSEDFQREHGVVQRELELGRDNPARQLSYAHSQNFYGVHPAGLPVIGCAAPLAGLTLADVLDYHGRMYVPQNMVFCVVGDVDTEKVLRRVRGDFAGLAAGRAPDLALPEVPPVAGTRRVLLASKVVKDDAEEMSFLTIPLVHADLYALDVLSNILSGGDSSRLNESIKRKQQLVTGISTGSWTPDWGKGQFYVYFRSNPAKADAAERAVIAELRKVAADGVTEEELDAAKRQKVAELVYSRQTVQSQAGTLVSDFLSTGDADFSELYTERIQQVTVEQVKAAARKYFDFDKLVITRMAPAASASTQSAATQPAERENAATFTLPNGLRVVLQPMPTVDLVSMVLVNRGGLLLETPATNGLGAVMAQLATRGVGSRSAEEISAFFDGAGGSLVGQCGNNTFYWQATVLAQYANRALPILADVVVRPAFPEKELEILRPIQEARIRQLDEGWLGRLNRLFRQEFFGGSPLALMRDGSLDVVSKATRQVVVEYHRQNVRAGGSVLTVFGKFDAQRVRADVEKLFADMPKGEPAMPDAPAPKVDARKCRFVHESDVQGAGIIVAAPGMKLTDLEDVVPMTVLDTIISGYEMPRGWLHDELRDKQLVYVVHAYNYPALVPGAFIVYAHTEPDKADEVDRIIRADLEKTRTYAFTRDEIDEAVNIILTVDLLMTQQVASLALEAATNELYGFGHDFQRRREALLRAVKPEDLTRVANRYFSSGFVTEILLPRKGPASPAAGRGIVP